MDWSTLLSTLIGAAVALTGVWLSPIVTARIGHKQWKRDKLSECGETLVDAMVRAGSTMPRYYQDLDENALSELKEIKTQLSTAVNGTMVFGSLELSQEAMQTHTAFSHATNCLFTGTEADQYDEHAEEFRKRIYRTIQLTRMELGVDFELPDSSSP
jgi:hypothetical protein